MITTLSCLLGWCWSGAGLWLLRLTDAKRRRVHELPPWRGPTPRRLLFVATLAPGVVLALVGIWAGFVIWLAGLVPIGWGVASRGPPGPAQASSRQPVP